MSRGKMEKPLGRFLSDSLGSHQTASFQIVNIIHIDIQLIMMSANLIFFWKHRYSKFSPSLEKDKLSDRTTNLDLHLL